MHPIFIPWCAGTSQKNVGLGLVPRQGRGAWHRRHLTLPSTNAPNFHTLVCRQPPASIVGLGLVPRQGRGAWHGRHLTLPSTNAPNFHTLVCRHQPEKCRAGACPPPGAGCGAQTTPDPPINQCTQFSYLGVPAPAGISRAGACPPPGAGCGAQTTPDPPINSQPRNGAEAPRNRKKPPVSQK